MAGESQCLLLLFTIKYFPPTFIEYIPPWSPFCSTRPFFGASLAYTPEPYQNYLLSTETQAYSRAQLHLSFQQQPSDGIPPFPSPVTLRPDPFRTLHPNNSCCNGNMRGLVLPLAAGEAKLAAGPRRWLASVRMSRFVLLYGKTVNGRCFQ